MTRPSDMVLDQLANDEFEMRTAARSAPVTPHLTTEGKVINRVPDRPGLGTLMDSDRVFDAGSPLLTLTNANLGYGAHTVLKQINLQIKAGEFWCLLGPNGEGKTTLIKSLLGALRPQRGRIFRHPDIRKSGRIGYVPQRLDLNPVLPTSVREFVLSGLVGLPKQRGIRKEERLRRILQLVGLSIPLDRNFWTLSGGQKQRVLVGRALIRSPRLLIVDEPTAGLDFAASGAVLGILRDLHRQFDVTIVFVTHDLQIAAQLADHVALVRRGTVTSGPHHETMNAENLSRTFGVPVHVEQQDGQILVRHQALQPSIDLMGSPDR